MPGRPLNFGGSGEMPLSMGLFDPHIADVGHECPQHTSLFRDTDRKRNTP